MNNVVVSLSFGFYDEVGIINVISVNKRKFHFYRVMAITDCITDCSWCWNEKHNAPSVLENV